MRSLFAFLVIGNIALAGWYALRSTPQAAVATRTLDVPSIELVGEPTRDTRREASSRGDKPAARERLEASVPRAGEAVADAVPGDVDGAPSARCISIGPFRDDADAQRAAETLAAAGHEPSKRSAEEDFWIGYWVYIPLDSESRRRGEAARLRDGGIADADVGSDEELGTLVSLGVFSQERRADRQREQARSLGSEPTVVERTRRALATWLDITTTAVPSIDLQTLQPAESATPLRQQACPAPDSP